MKKTFLIQVAVVTLIFGCSKKAHDLPTPSKSDETTTSRTFKEEVFLAGGHMKQWEITHYFVNGTNIISMAPCLFDNIQTLYRSGEFVEYEGATKCDPAASDIYDFGRWSLDETRTTLVMNTNNINLNFEILELTPNNVKLRTEIEGTGTVEFWLQRFVR